MHSNSKSETTTTSPDCQSQSAHCPITLPSSDEFEFLIVSDGSGWEDGFGGFGAVVIAPKFFVYESAMGAGTHTTVWRTEFMAILTGLRVIVDKCDMEHTHKLEQQERNKPRVLIRSDSESLVNGINIPLQRKKNKDLWAQFTWYERYFDIQAKHIPRDTLLLHKAVDALASGGRMALLDYYNRNIASGVRMSLYDYYSRQKEAKTV